MRKELSPLLAVIRDRFDIGRVIQAVSGVSGMSNETVVVDSERGKFVVRRIRSARHHFEEVLLLHAARASLSMQLRDRPGLLPYETPSYIHAKDGNSYTTVNGQLCEVYGFIEGNTEWDLTEDQVRAQATGLARCHDAFGYLASNLENVPTLTPEVILHNFLRLEGDVENAVPHSIQKVVVATLPVYSRIAKQLADSWVSVDFGPTVLLHGDFHRGNLLFRKERLVGILDFDNMAFGPRMVDIGRALGRRRTFDQFVEAFGNIAPLSTTEHAGILHAKRLAVLGSFTKLSTRVPHSVSRTVQVIKHCSLRDLQLIDR